MAAFGFGIFTTLVCAILSIWEGFVLTKLWAWFLVPLFGFHPLGIAMAIGLCLIMSYLTHQRQDTGDKALSEVLLNSSVHGILNGLIVLLVGWMVTLFM